MSRREFILIIIFIIVMVLLLGLAMIKAHASEHKTGWDVPTPTVGPCKPWHESFDVEVVCPTPTLIPTPSASPSATPVPTVIPNNNSGGGPSFPGSTTNAPGAATCIIPFSAPILQGFSENTVNGTETYSWWASTAKGITKQSLEYGYQAGSPLFGVDNLASDVTSLTINGLDMNLISWLRVGAWQGGCVEWSNWFN